MASGRLLATVGVTILSFDALLVRLVDSSAWNILVWRGLFIATTLGAATLLMGQWRELKRLPGRMDFLLIICLYAASQSLFVLSIQNTRVANTVVILSISPFFSALFSRWLLKERLPWHTGLAILAGMAGVWVVFSAELDRPSGLGDALALLLAALMGLALTLLRKRPEFPRAPILAGSGLITCLMALPLASPLSVSSEGFLWLMLMGLLQLPLASLLIMLSTRELAAAEVSLFLLIETLLGPLWVWWILGEAPPARVVAGGSLIVSALAAHSLYALWKAQRAT